jgi:hypothetical protein
MLLLPDPFPVSLMTFPTGVPDSAWVFLYPPGTGPDVVRSGIYCLNGAGICAGRLPRQSVFAAHLPQMRSVHY